MRALHLGWIASVMVAASFAMVFAAEGAKEGSNVLTRKMKALDGKEVDLGKYKGKVVLFVNVASHCGYTKQYKGLQELHDKYHAMGLEVVGVPCNQFGGQEPGTAKEIAEFCDSKYSVKFDLLEKVDVNGDGACDLYKQMKSGKFEGPIKWNFEKFLVNRRGEVVARFGSSAEPMSPAMVKAIEAEIEKK